MDVSFSFVCPVIDHEFRHNIVKVAVDPRGDSRVDPQMDGSAGSIRWMDPMDPHYDEIHFNNRTDA